MSISSSQGGWFSSDQGGWLPEEEALLLSRFGEEVTLDIIERSPVDPTVVMAWVAWDFQHPEIYVLDFKERTRYDTIGGVDFANVASVRAHETWGPYFPEPQANQEGEE
jgi:hypothetical protein